MSDIGKSKKQRVFAIRETTAGTLKVPAAANFIRVAGDAVVNQNPSFTDSLEKKDSLDVLDQFQDAMPAGSWSVPMYIRACGLGDEPQGGIFIQSLLGSLNPATSASLASGWSATRATLYYRKLTGGTLPAKSGVLLAGSEQIFYTTRTESNTTQGYLTGVTRAYYGTSAATHATNSAGFTLTCKFYKEATDASTFSLWVETDHTVQALSGATVNQGTLSLSNTGAVSLACSGEGMRMYWAGSSTVSSDAAAGVRVKVRDARLFSAGMYIQNYTDSDTNSGAGYKVTTSNATDNYLILATAHSAAWASPVVIKGYLPTESSLGTALEGRDTAVLLDSVSATFKNSELSISCPKGYITDEVGTTYPQDFLPDTRQITSTLGIYFRKADAKWFQRGIAGANVPIKLTFGDTAGYQMVVYMPSCKVTVPQTQINGPAVELSMEFKALGVDGEDSLEITFI